MKICVAGVGAFGIKHLEALALISDAEVSVLVGGSDADHTHRVADRFRVPTVCATLDDALARSDVDAVILCTPTPLHARQAIACLQAGKHVQVEIPMADNLADAEALVREQERTGLVAMAGHTRRYNPSHQWVNRRLRTKQLQLQHLHVQTFFFRRSNTNLLGKSRSWTDHLLWHHACHTVDLFQYQTGEPVTRWHALQGPPHPELGIAMDMSIHMQVPSGALCSLALSFNNEGPQGTTFRYICDNGTYLANYDDLVDGKGNGVDLSGVDVSMNGIELQDREFIAAIQASRQPRSSVASVLPAYECLHRLSQTLG